IALLRGELLDTWQEQLPEQAPNHFALNVLPEERDVFAARLAELAPQPAPLYPIVAGRLTLINGEPVQGIVSKDSQGERAIQRDLSLTWAEELPQGNLLQAGQWWNVQPNEQLPGVSVESKLAESLGLSLGDELAFSVGGVERKARVSSLRQVKWDSFQPNFYMIF